jgi:hypothetical protein
MVNRIKAMWARLWRGRGRQTSEHEFYDQYEPVATGPRPRPGAIGIRRWRLDVVREASIVWDRIKAAFGRLWRPRRRRTAEHGFYDQHAASRYRSQQDIDAARGLSYQPPEGPTAI